MSLTNPKQSQQFSAVYAEAAIAYLETQIPQVMLWFDDDARWDFAPVDEPLNSGEVIFLLQDGWDGQLMLETSTDPFADDYRSGELRDDIVTQLEDEGVAEAMLQQIIERRAAAAEGREPDEEGAPSRGHSPDVDQ